MAISDIVIRHVVSEWCNTCSYIIGLDVIDNNGPAQSRLKIKSSTENHINIPLINLYVQLTSIYIIAVSL